MLESGIQRWSSQTCRNTLAAYAHEPSPTCAGRRRSPHDPRPAGQPAESAGYEALRESSPERVLETVIRERPQLVLLDAQMPPRERFFALRELAAPQPPERPPVIVLSGHDDQSIRELALSLGADGF